MQQLLTVKLLEVFYKYIVWLFGIQAYLTNFKKINYTELIQYFDVPICSYESISV
jgi:hypothetical protein